MKSFCTSALVLLAGLGWAPSQAAAQAGAYGSQTLLPLPAVTPVGVVTASYDLPAGGTGPDSSMFASSQQEPVPESGEVIDGSSGPSQFQQAVQSDWTDCGECESSRGHWFGKLGALVMGRNRPNPYWTTSDINTGANLLNTQDAGANWTGGWEVTAGYMCSNRCGTGPGFGFTYWGLGHMPGFAEINSATNTLGTPIDLTGVTIGGAPASDFFENSASQRITRDDRVDNFEANFYFGTWNVNRWTIVPFAGFRYLRFDERLTFAGLASGSTWGANSGTDEAYLSFRTVNNLFGGQIGTYANYWVTDRFGLFVGPKVGLFGNQMNDRTLLYRGDFVTTYDIAAYKSDFSLLGEIDTGFTYFFQRGLFAYMGYRVVGITNVALGDNQFLPFLSDAQGFSEVKQSGSLILHGVMMGGGVMF